MGPASGYDNPLIKTKARVGPPLGDISASPTLDFFLLTGGGAPGLRLIGQKHEYKLLPSTSRGGGNSSPEENIFSDKPLIADGRRGGGGN